MLKLDVIRVLAEKGGHGQSWVSTVTLQVRVEKRMRVVSQGMLCGNWKGGRRNWHEYENGKEGKVAILRWK